ncbi:MAG: hypothetical protein IT373_33920 [Polyangiaceae bacterium]|nr:hypothetical protein [Polyangiaceae bacterium]
MRAPFAVPLALAAVAACSVANAPSEVQPGGGGAPTCSAPAELCGGACVDTASDPAHCGDCATACVGDQQCVQGACVLQCGALTPCGVDCIDTWSDPTHCGTCTNVCPGAPNASATCAGATCGIECANGFRDCTGGPADGCETHTDADPQNCNGCSNVCPPVVNGTAGCTGGVCGVGDCELGFGDCNGVPGDGCEADFSSDPSHCSGCDSPCGPGAPQCIGGSCTNVDLTGVFASYASDGRLVHIWKTPGPCVDLALYTNFCQSHGLAWWRPTSQQDAQQLVDFAWSLDQAVTWVQVHGLVTGFGTIGGYTVAVGDPSCCAGHDGSAFAAFRQNACSFCEPATGACTLGTQNTGNQSCCWDKSNPYDWFACQE